MVSKISDHQIVKLESKTDKKKFSLIIGPVPPPVHGVTAAIRRVLDSGGGGQFHLVHLDTSERRGIVTIG